MEVTRKEIGANENEKHWNIVTRRELNGKKTIIYMVLQDKDGYRWEVHETKIPFVLPWRYTEMMANYWETYSPLVNWMSVRDMITLIILREIHTKPVYLFWRTLRPT